MGRMSIVSAVSCSGGGVPASQLPFFDNFAGPDANPIGSPYEVFPFFDTFGNLQRVSNDAFGTGNGLRNSVWLPSIAISQHGYTEVTVGALGVGGGLMALAYGGINSVAQVAWTFGPDDGGIVYINRNTAAGFNTLVTAGHVHTPGDTYRLEWEQVGADVHLTGRINGAIVLGPTIDPGLTAGVYGGLMLRNTDCQGLSFGMGAL